MKKGNNKKGLVITKPKKIIFGTVRLSLRQAQAKRKRKNFFPFGLSLSKA